jgi:transcriptional regulator with XRE-family HTH domain
MAPARIEVAEERTLGKFLQGLRAAKRLSLRQVEEATEGEVSNAYLSQLENDKIAKPSPSILYSLATVYGASYEHLMHLAGYLDAATAKSRARVATFAIDDLTPDEEQELLRYLGYLRSTRKRSDDGKR